MFLSNLSIKRPILMTMVILVFLVFGFLSYLKLSLGLMPKVDMPIVTVQTIYAGADPKEIENSLTKKIEDAIATVPQIKYINSYSMRNVSYIIVEFELDKDVDEANQEVKDKVDAIFNDLPKDAEKPIVSKYNPMSKPVLELVLYGNYSPTELYDIADNTLKDRLSQINGVAKVELTGGIKREIHVAMPVKSAYQNYVSPVEISQYIAAENMDMPAGTYTQGTNDFSVKLQGKFKSLEQINNLKIKTPLGEKKLGQMAQVEDTGEKATKKSVYYNNLVKKRYENIIQLSVVKTSEGNEVEIARELEKKLPELKKLLPSKAKLEIISKDSDFVESSVNDTLSTVFLGIIITGFVLLFFLHDLRSTLIVAVAMPTSIIATFLFMEMSGFTLNTMSLMGLSASVGGLVANSVVVLENIFRHKYLGNKRKEAAAIGTAEVAIAVIASTLTNIVVFLPIASMSSIVGKYFKEFAMTMVYATIFSLLISFTLTPMLSSLILPEKEKKSKIGKALEKLFSLWERIYHDFLKFILSSKKMALLVVFLVICLFIFSMKLFSKVGFEFIPKMDEGNIEIKMELPTGSSLEKTANTYFQIENRLKKYSEIKHILVKLGDAGTFDQATNMANISVKLIDENLRSKSTSEVMNLLNKDLADIPNSKIFISMLSKGGGDVEEIEFYLMGKDMNVLRKYKDLLMQKTKNIVGLENFENSAKNMDKEITLLPKRKELSELGINVNYLAFILRASVDGIIASEYNDVNDDYDIRVKFDEEDVNSIEKLQNLPVITQRGVFRLSQLADIEYKYAIDKLIRKDKITCIRFTGSTSENVALGDVMKKIEKAVAELNLPEGYMIDWGGSSELMQDTVKDMVNAAILAIILIYMLLAAILESFVEPLMILSTIPLSLIGVVFAMLITGLNLNIISMMAIVMLIGIVVNSAILMMDYTNSLIREKKLEVKDALLEACPTKLKPILMSSLAIILGMLPMALKMGDAGKEMRQGMGVVTIGGLTVATFLTLFIIPCVFYLFNKKTSSLKIKEKF